MIVDKAAVKDEFANALMNLFDDGPTRVRASAGTSADTIDLKLSIPKKTLDEVGEKNMEKILALLIDRDV